MQLWMFCFHRLLTDQTKEKVRSWTKHFSSREEKRYITLNANSIYVTARFIWTYQFYSHFLSILYINTWIKKSHARKNKNLCLGLTIHKHNMHKIHRTYRDIAPRRIRSQSSSQAYTSLQSHAPWSLYSLISLSFSLLRMDFPAEKHQRKEEWCNYVQPEFPNFPWRPETYDLPVQFNCLLPQCLLREAALLFAIKQ